MLPKVQPSTWAVLWNPLKVLNAVASAATSKSTDVLFSVNSACWHAEGSSNAVNGPFCAVCLFIIWLLVSKQVRFVPLSCHLPKALITAEASELTKKEHVCRTLTASHNKLFLGILSHCTRCDNTAEGRVPAVSLTKSFTHLPRENILLVFYVSGRDRYFSLFCFFSSQK